MKKLAFLFVVGFALFSCNKDYEKMTVVRDCTGDYLRNSSGQDYYVCNEDAIVNISTGTKIKVSYDKLEECFGLLEPPGCGDTHLFESKIEILELH